MNTNIEEQEQEQVYPSVPLGAVMNLLNQNTNERNACEWGLKEANNKIKNQQEEYIKLLGRLSVYEDTRYEALSYLEKNNIFVSCKSENVGVLTTIGLYEIKTGKRKGEKVKAHFTENGKWISNCSDKDNIPKYYLGYFSVKKYKDKLIPYLVSNGTTFTSVNNLFEFKHK